MARNPGSGRAAGNQQQRPLKPATAAMVRHVGSLESVSIERGYIGNPCARWGNPGNSCSAATIARGPGQCISRASAASALAALGCRQWQRVDREQPRAAVTEVIHATFSCTQFKSAYGPPATRRSGPLTSRDIVATSGSSD